ncbi:9280_t:CDS:1, partial [Paraglomus occultum]
GFGVNHDPHLLYILYAVQILLIEDAIDAVDVGKIVEYVSSLQDKETGAFKEDEWGEIDIQFSYSAYSS